MGIIHITIFISETSEKKPQDNLKHDMLAVSGFYIYGLEDNSVHLYIMNTIRTYSSAHPVLFLDFQGYRWSGSMNIYLHMYIYSDSQMYLC